MICIDTRVTRAGPRVTCNAPRATQFHPCVICVDTGVTQVLSRTAGIDTRTR